MTVFDAVTCPKSRRCSRGLNMHDEDPALTVAPGCQMSGSFQTGNSGDAVASSVASGNRRSVLKMWCSSDSWMSAKP